MVIQNQPLPVDPATVAAASSNSSASTSSTSGSGTSSSTDPSAAGGLSDLSNESTFLQLLVSQIKNQDPLNPTDSTQFLSQLTELSQLEQLTAIRQAVQGGATLSPTGTPSTSSTVPGTSNVSPTN